MNQEWINRYVYAVVRYLPEKQQADIEAELRGLIADMLEARCGEVPPTDDDLRAVLEELGTPTALAAQYSPQAGKALIGPPYYWMYIRNLKLLMVGLPLVVVALRVLSMVLRPGEGFGDPFEFLGDIFYSLCFGFTFCTLFFAFYQWRGLQVGGVLDTIEFEGLSPVPHRRQRIRLWEPILTILFSIAFAVLFLALPVSMGFYYNGQTVPLFDEAVLHSRWYCVVIMSLLGIAMILEGRRTVRLAWFNAAANVISAIFAALLFTAPGLTSPALPAAVAETLGTGFPFNWLGQFHYFFLGIILFGLAVDTVTELVQAYRSTGE